MTTMPNELSFLSRLHVTPITYALCRDKKLNSL